MVLEWFRTLTPAGAGEHVSVLRECVLAA